MTLIPPQVYDQGIRFFDLKNQKGVLEVTEVKSTINFVLKVVAIGMAVPSSSFWQWMQHH